MKKLRSWLRRDDGLSEAASFIFVFPIMAALIFLLLEVGVNVQTRTAVDNIVQDTTRSAALDGGYNNPHSSLLPAAYTALPGTNSGWARVGSDRLIAACNSHQIRSTVPCANLRITCNTAIAVHAGDTITCAVAGGGFRYQTVSGLSTNPVFGFGLQGLFTTPIDSSASAAAAIGQFG